MYKCEICNKEFEYCSTLSNHISRHHKQITKEEYYKQYIMKSTDSNGICPVCGKNTKFLGLSYGYRVHCSKKCSTLDSNVQNKKNNTLITKYGTTNIYEREDVKEQALKKRKQTTKDRFGVESVFQLKSVQQKAQKNSHTKEAMEKQKQTNLIKYGVENVFQSEEVRQKMSQYNYTPEVVERRKQTNLKKYGVENVFQRPDVRKNALSEKSMQKIIETKRKNRTFNTSKPEDEAYEELVKIFGTVKRQYKSEVYPFLCDFYIPSEDLYIELNLHWTHGFHWFDENSKEDQETLEKWKEKAKNSKYYQYAIDTWTVRDVEKRQIVEENKINYLVFWSKQSFYDYIKEIGVEH